MSSFWGLVLIGHGHSSPFWKIAKMALFNPCTLNWKLLYSELRKYLSPWWFRTCVDFRGCLMMSNTKKDLTRYRMRYASDCWNESRSKKIHRKYVVHVYLHFMSLFFKGYKKTIIYSKMHLRTLPMAETSSDELFH